MFKSNTSGVSQNRGNRIKEYLSIVEKRGFLSSKEIIDKYQLSRMTINRDFDLICKMMPIYEKTYGGIRKVGKTNSLEKFFIRWDENREEKKKIARFTSSLFKSGERIFLAPGTTTFFIAQELLNRNDLVVITNSLPIACLLPKKSHLEIFFIGGTVVSGELDVHDFKNEHLLKSLNISKAILGTWGIDAIHGITTAHSEGMNQMIINHSKETIIVADHTKFGVIAPYKVDTVENISLVVTTQLASSLEIKRIRDKGVNVIAV